jgi:hypothetical protein
MAARGIVEEICEVATHGRQIPCFFLQSHPRRLISDYERLHVPINQLGQALARIPKQIHALRGRRAADDAHAHRIHYARPKRDFAGRGKSNAHARPKTRANCFRRCHDFNACRVSPGAVRMYTKKPEIPVAPAPSTFPLMRRVRTTSGRSDTRCRRRHSRSGSEPSLDSGGGVRIRFSLA